MSKKYLGRGLRKCTVLVLWSDAKANKAFSGVKIHGDLALLSRRSDSVGPYRGPFDAGDLVQFEKKKKKIKNGYQDAQAAVRASSSRHREKKADGRSAGKS